MGYPKGLRCWIKACITHLKFSIAMNEDFVGYILGAKGIRQGDPLSPYHFIIGMNILSSLLNEVVVHGVFEFHPKCKRLELTHLSFANDLLVSTKGMMESTEAIKKYFDLFLYFI